VRMWQRPVEGLLPDYPRPLLCPGQSVPLHWLVGAWSTRQRGWMESPPYGKKEKKLGRRFMTLNLNNSMEVRMY
jgi:hypothetical protein